MQRTVFTVLFLAACPLSLNAENREPAINIGARRELMLDDYLFSKIESLEFRQHSLREEEEVLDFGADWEGRKHHGITVCGYPVVFADNGKFRMYYSAMTGLRFKPVDPETQFTCYCESTDGIHWKRVILDRIEFEGSTRNNILLKGQICHNFAPFIDTRPGVPPDQRYKAVGGNGKAYVFASPDGITWRTWKGEPLWDGEEDAFDRHGASRGGNNPGHERAILDSLNVAFWDAEHDQYVLFFRAYLPCLSRDGKRKLPETRSVMRCTSKDFLNWDKIEPIEYGEPRRAWIHSLYTSGLKPYGRAPHIYLGFPLRMADRRPFYGGSFGMSETAFMYSRDTKNFTLIDEPFLRPGREQRNWTKHGNMIAWGMLQTADDELSFYYMQHDHQPDTHLRRGTIRLDGFRSLHAGRFPGGVAITKPLVFNGDRLEINASTGAGGGVRVGFMDAETMKPIKGFEESSEFYGDQIQHFMHFGKRRDISSMAGRRIRLKLSMYGADLYSLKFSGK